METSPKSPAANALAAGTLFAITTAAIAEPTPGKKRGSFLTRRFFGGTDKKETGPGTRAPNLPATDPAPAGHPDAEGGTPDDGPVPPFSGSFARILLTSPVEGTVAYGLPPVSENFGSAQPLAAEPAEPETPAPAPPVDFPLPRLSVPTFHSPPPDPMTPEQPATSAAATGRASAQLTLGFEVTSLQLSPFFRLGSVQLRALSNVAALSLVADAASERPLAAGISFGIERVELDAASHIKSIVLKPLGESRESAAPASRLHVDSVAITGDDAPISVTTAGTASTVVQLVGVFAIAALEFSPTFEIDVLRLEPASNTVLLRVSPSTEAGGQGQPSSFEIAEVQIDDSAQIRGARLLPAASGNG